MATVGTGTSAGSTAWDRIGEAVDSAAGRITPASTTDSLAATATKEVAGEPLTATAISA